MSIGADIVFVGWCQKRKQLIGGDLIGPEPVEGVAANVAVGIGAEAALEHGQDLPGHGRIAALAEGGDRSGPHHVVLGSVPGRLKKLGL
jgi:hypothetical protein